MEMSFLQFIQEHMHSQIMDVIMETVTKLGDSGFIWIFMGIVMICIKKYRKCGVAVLICLLITLGITQGIKAVIMRPRPFTHIENFILEIPIPFGTSFPSGHTSSSFTAATAANLFGGKPWRWTAVLAIMIAFSRLYFCVHYPTDIFVGALIGTAVAIGIFYLARRTKKI